MIKILFTNATNVGILVASDVSERDEYNELVDYRSPILSGLFLIIVNVPYPYPETIAIQFSSVCF